MGNQRHVQTFQRGSGQVDDLGLARYLGDVQHCGVNLGSPTHSKIVSHRSELGTIAPGQKQPCSSFGVGPRRLRCDGGGCADDEDPQGFIAAR